MEKLGMIAAQVLYLFLPLLPGVAISGVVMRHDLWAWLKRPIDGGVFFRGHQLFGDNKTWRGLVCIVIGCITTVAVQKYVIGHRVGAIAIIDYDEANVFVLGTMLGVAAVLGELPNSFIKRQLGIPPGKMPRGTLAPVFYIWDQVDFLFTTWPVLLFWVRPSWPLVLMSFVLIFVIHQLISLVGYIIGARESIY